MLKSCVSKPNTKYAELLLRAAPHKQNELHPTDSSKKGGVAGFYELHVK